MKFLLFTLSAGLLSLAVLCAPSCSVEDGEDAFLNVLSTVPEPPGENCADGGFLLSWGPDIDNDHVLDDTEILSSEYICNGTHGTTGLVDLSEEPPGENCLIGGHMITSGVDLNLNSILDPEEITETEYICDSGAPLTSIADSGPDENCPAGGKVITTGVDNNGNGTLDPEEISGTNYLCTDTHLTTINEEEPGESCEFGGMRVDNGMDMNADGVLEPEEIEDSELFCNDGDMLFSVENEGWGIRCPRGGIAINTGIDNNMNNDLEADEIRETSYVCNAFVEEVDLGFDHSCALMSDQTVRCWGSSEFGQLGDGSSSTFKITPVTVTGITNAISITSGKNSSCAALETGEVACWGKNNFGQLGNGTTEDSAVPVMDRDIENAIQVASGESHSCALMETSEVYCWGRNHTAQLGNNSTTLSRTPVQVNTSSGTLQDQTGIVAGDNHTCSYNTSEMYCWGGNFEGQLGNGNTNNQLVATQIEWDGDNLRGLSAGTNHTCAQTNAGNVFCWGNNAFGQLGTESEEIRTLIPARLFGLHGVKSLSASANSTCISDNAGLSKCWGDNTFGQLGDGTTEQRDAPIEVATEKISIAVSTGGNHTCALLNNRGIICWGYNNNGQLGDGTTGGEGTTRKERHTPVENIIFSGP